VQQLGRGDLVEALAGDLVEALAGDLVEALAGDLVERDQAPAHAGAKRGDLVGQPFERRDPDLEIGQLAAVDRGPGRATDGEDLGVEQLGDGLDQVAPAPAGLLRGMGQGRPGAFLLAAAGLGLIRQDQTAQDHGASDGSADRGGRPLHGGSPVQGFEHVSDQGRGGRHGGEQLGPARGLLVEQLGDRPQHRHPSPAFEQIPRIHGTRPIRAADRPSGVFLIGEGRSRTRGVRRRVDICAPVIHRRRGNLGCDGLDLVARASPSDGQDQQRRRPARGLAGEQLAADQVRRRPGRGVRERVQVRPPAPPIAAPDQDPGL